MGGGQLPSWIQFDNVTNHFSGMATTPAVTSIQVTANDAVHLTVSAFFLLTAQSPSPFHVTSHSPAISGGVIGGVAVLLFMGVGKSTTTSNEDVEMSDVRILST